MAENGAKRQEIRLAVQHNSAVDSSYGLQNCAWDIERALLVQQVMELVLCAGDRMFAMIGQRGKQISPRNRTVAPSIGAQYPDPSV